ncbi:hypothetical protein [Actinomadura litoris]|uniref:hypothetical protein n=1 Tax=Actinomadura litoris TaxID=2678616 RepID=UPI001FA7794A|nr:hypothetical protein [Actinomadura litoris]
MSPDHPGTSRADQSAIPDTVPRYNRRPVPWVAQWSGELVRKPRPRVRHEEAPAGGWRLTYRDPTDTDWWAPTSDHKPVLWRRTGTDRSGTPQYALLNTIRQRTAMTEHLCQVCGQSAAVAGGVAWLMHAIEWRHVTAPMGAVEPGWKSLHTALSTTNPPTCTNCWQIAARMCPSIREHGAVPLTVGVVRPVGVTGDVYPMGVGRPEPRHGTFGEPEMGHMMARLLVVELDDVQVYPALTSPPPRA